MEILDYTGTEHCDGIIWIIIGRPTLEHLILFTIGKIIQSLFLYFRIFENYFSEKLNWHFRKTKFNNFEYFLYTYNFNNSRVI